MHKRKIIDLWSFTVCCKRRKRRSRVGSSELRAEELPSRRVPARGRGAVAIANAGDAPAQGKALLPSRLGKR